MNAMFKVGIAREKITPPLVTVLYGYPNMRRAESVHDDLYLTAYAFSSGEDTAPSKTTAHLPQTPLPPQGEGIANP